MASKNRNQSTNLRLQQEMAQNPYHFGFYEALRQLESFNSENKRLGQSIKPSEDKVRLGQEPSMKFAPSSLVSFSQDRKTPKLMVYLFGLFGPNGPLPLHLTEYTRNRLRNAKDAVLVEFMDLFHHRLISLFYRAWADKEPTVQFDRPDQDRFSTYVGALLGIGSPNLQNRDAIPDLCKLHFSAHLGCHNQHPEGLQSIITGFFRLPVKIHEFIGEWLDLPKDSYCYLRPNGNGGQLGSSSVIGTCCWSCQQKFRIKLGPLGLTDFKRMLPIGKSVKSLIAIVRNYTGFEYNWDLNLILKKNEVPAAQLGEHVRLGWTSWLMAQERHVDADDLILSLETGLASGGEI